MSGADLKQTLQQGGRIFGTMISIGRSPRWIPSLDGVGLDYVIIDTEHSPRSRGELGDYLTMFNTTGVVPIVRIPIPDSHYVTMAIDAGAQGVLAPYCETVAQAREVVKAAKFRPLKGAAAEQALETGEFPSDASRQYLEARNRNNICIIGIESEAAVANLDAILAVPHIDAIFVGPNDMSISLGVPDDYAQEIYQTTVKSIIDRAEARGLPTLVHHQTPELSEYWIEQGARFVLHGTDRRALAEGFRADFSRLRSKAASLAEPEPAKPAPRHAAAPLPNRCICGCGRKRTPQLRFSSGHVPGLKDVLDRILGDGNVQEMDYRIIANRDLAVWAEGRADDELVARPYRIADYRKALAKVG